MSDLIFEVNGPVARITLNRPEVRNAFSDEMLRLWVEALIEAQDRQDVRAIVVTGSGSAFCAGGDVKSMAKGNGFLTNAEQTDQAEVVELKNSLWKKVHRVALTLQDVDKPVIASINGAATGAGLDMALLCDLRIAADTAMFAESYVNIGLVPGDGGAFLLPRLVGLSKALELLWTGDAFDAEEAERIGLVNKVVPEVELETATAELANKLSAGPPIAMALIKRAVFQGLNSDLRTALDSISSHMAIVTQTRDYKEGLEAFLEKRKPDFTGQ